MIKTSGGNRRFGARPLRGAAMAVSIALATAACVAPPTTPTTTTTTTVPPASGPIVAITAGNETSQTARVSSGGDWVAFDSTASDLVVGDFNSVKDVFVYDTSLETTSMITQGNGSSSSASIATNGDIVFDSNASDLGPLDTNSRTDIYLWERASGTTSRITDGNGNSTDPWISPDGSYVTWESWATNLVAGDTTASRDIFIWERSTNTISAVTSGDGTSGDPVVSDDGTIVAFESLATDLVANDTNSDSDVFVWTRAGTTTTALTAGTKGSYDPTITADGTRVTFWSYAPELAPGDINGELADVFMWTNGTGTTRVTAGNFRSEDPRISADGSYLAFYASANNLVADDNNGQTDIFLHEIGTNTTTRITDGDGPSEYASISNGAGTIVFASDASDLVVGATSTYRDVYIMR